MVSGVKGNAAPPVMVPHDTVPEELVTSACVAEQLWMPEIARLVVVALVDVEFCAVKFWSVEEAVATKPPEKVSVVEVASAGNG